MGSAEVSCTCDRLQKQMGESPVFCRQCVYIYRWYDAALMYATLTSYVNAHLAIVDTVN
jgi:hypothetical protein